MRLAGVYLAMLTLAFAQIVWSIAFQWDAVTGGSNGLVGVWPPRVARRSAALLRVHARCRVIVAALLALVRSPASPFGFALRGARDSPLRAAAIGIDVRATQWRGFALAGAFAGLAGGLFAFSKGSISPESLAIPRSVDALVMVLLGGLNALFGPLLGAAAFTWLHDTLARSTEYWRAMLGVLILRIVLVFPNGHRRRVVARAATPMTADERGSHAAVRQSSGRVAPARAIAARRRPRRPTMIAAEFTRFSADARCGLRRRVRASALADRRGIGVSAVAAALGAAEAVDPIEGKWIGTAGAPGKEQIIVGLEFRRAAAGALGAVPERADPQHVRRAEHGRESSAPATRSW